MAFIRAKKVKGKTYFYLVKGVRENGKVRQEILQYFGTTRPEGYVVPTKASVVRKEAIKKNLEVLNVTNLPLTRGRGGNRHPIAVKQFILDRLARVGEDYISGLHQAYKDALDQLARDRKRVYYYYKPTYHSFSQKVWALITEGKVEFSGRKEPSDDSHFTGWKNKPMRRYYRLARAR